MWIQCVYRHEWRRYADVAIQMSGKTMNPKFVRDLNLSYSSRSVLLRGRGVGRRRAVLCVR
jgi:hypothetical protein